MVLESGESMLTEILAMQKTKKAILGNIVYFALFLALYFTIDSLSGGYVTMAQTYGVWLVVLNILLNIIMSAASAMMFGFSSAMVRLTGKEGKGTFATAFSVIFGMLTYGCTPCVIAFFAAIGITFSVAVLPLAGFPYKLISLGLLALGFLWLVYESKHIRCTIPKPDEKKSTED